MKSSKYFYLVSVVGFFALLGSVWIFLYAPVNQLQKKWILEQEKYLQKTVAIRDLQKEFGYGGLIHNFKNFVIRRDRHYLESSLAASPRVEEKIIELEKLISQQNFGVLDPVKEAFRQYGSHAKWMGDNFELIQGYPVEALDTKVRVDDSGALAALNIIYDLSVSDFTKAKNLTENMETSYQETLIGWTFVVTIIYWGMLASLNYVYQSFKKTYRHLESINELSPLALLLVSHGGKILQVNSSFRRMFNIPEELDITKVSVEQFVPDSFKDQHRIDREQFQSSERSVAMYDRGKKFHAKKLTGEEFEIDIAISSMRQDSERFALAIIGDKSEENILKRAAEIDHLTNIYNRRFAENALTNELYRQDRYGGQLTVLLIDVDNFKTVNDSLGHDIGDEVLKQVVEIIQSNTRKSDILARWGGDEFLCLLPSTDIKDAEVLAAKLVNTTSTTFRGKKLPTTLSVGVAASEAGQSPLDVLKCADSALYRAKENGRNGFVSHTNI